MVTSIRIFPYQKGKLTALGVIRVDVLCVLVAANTAPVALSMLLGPRCAQSIDAGHVWLDGRPVFGPHKTWRGLIVGSAAAGLVGAAFGIDLMFSVIAGLAALIGDLLSSFVKRRLGMRSGEDALWIDQLPEGLAPILALSAPLSLTALSALSTLIVFVLIAIAGAKLRQR